MKVVVVKNKKQWMESLYADEKRYRGLEVVEDETMDAYTYKIREVEDGSTE
jgi:hypothetical protein